MQLGMELTPTHYKSSSPIVKQCFIILIPHECQGNTLYKKYL